MEDTGSTFPLCGENARRTGTSAGGFTKTLPSLASRWKNAGQQTEAGGADYGIRGKPSPCKCQGSCAATVAALSSAMVPEYFGTGTQVQLWACGESPTAACHCAPCRGTHIWTGLGTSEEQRDHSVLRPVSGKPPAKPSSENAVGCSHGRSPTLLQADKKGGFVPMPKDLFGTKAMQAAESNSRSLQSVSKRQKNPACRRSPSRNLQETQCTKPKVVLCSCQDSQIRVPPQGYHLGKTAGHTWSFPFRVQQMGFGECASAVCHHRLLRITPYIRTSAVCERMQICREVPKCGWYQ